MECTDASPLIPLYLDGELSEAQAGPLRKHLLDCQACRGAAQGEKNVKRWFVEGAAVAIPKDFSARVARRAFAGDTGERWTERTAAVSAVREDELLRFVLRITALAAALLIGLSIAIGQLRLPGSGRLMADVAPEASLERALEELDRLNAPPLPVQGEKRAEQPKPGTGTPEDSPR